MVEKVTIGQGILELRAETGQASQAFQNFTSKTESEFKSLQGKISAIGDLMMVQFAGKIARAMSDSVMSIANHAEQVKRLAATYGTSVENISRMEYAAKLSGTSLESVGSAMKFLSKNAADNKKQFDELGISTKNLNGTTADGHELFIRTLDYLSKQTDGAKRVSDAVKLMGRGATDILPLVDGFSAAEREADKLGITMSKAGVNAADRFGDSVQSLGMQWEALKRDALEPVLPVLDSVIKSISEAIRWWKEAGSSFGDWIAGAGGAEDRLAEAQRRQAERAAADPEFAARLAEMQRKREEERAAREEQERKMEAIRLKAEQAALAEAKRTKEIQNQNAELAKQPMGPPSSLANPPEEVIGSGSVSFGSQVQTATEMQSAYNTTLQEEAELRLYLMELINAGAVAQQEADAAKAESVIAYNQATMQNAMAGMQSMTQAMGTMAGNNRSMFVFTQAIDVAQAIINAIMTWTETSKKGGLAGFALGAGIFAKLMAMVATIKAQKAPATPQMKMPGAAEGGIIFKPSVIAVAEKRPEIVTPLDKFQKMLSSSGPASMTVKIGDERGLLRYLAFEIDDIKRREMLTYG